MILTRETFDKFGYSVDTIGLYSNRPVISKCDICGSIFEKPIIKISMARKNSKSTIDVCTNIDCIKKKREQTMIHRFGVSNAGQSDVIREKVKHTCFRKFGVDNPMKSPEVVDSLKMSNLEKYGVDNVFKSEEIKEKIKKANLEKYGVVYSSQSNEIKQKVKNTNLLIYGKQSYSQTDEYIKKTNTTNIKKYGNKWYLGSKLHLEKTRKYYQENFGVPWYNYTKDFEEKLKKHHFERMYRNLTTGSRLKNLYDPMFTLSEYNGVNHDYKFKCKSCGNIFLDNIDDGKLPCCKICHPVKAGQSKIEKDLKSFLSSIGIQNIKEKSRTPIQNQYELDIYLPDEKIAIEINGNFWHSELSGNRCKTYHINKTNLCEKNGIRLIHIFEDEWVFKSNIIKDRIKSIIGIGCSKKIFARKCSVKEISDQLSSSFLNNHHVQGSAKSSVRLGLFHENNLISVMTFGRPRFENSNLKFGEYELIRYASSSNVVGGANKIISFFINNYNPLKIISYADLRWVSKNKNMYITLGFKLIGQTPPNYWYMSKKNYLQRINRLSFRKSELHTKLKSFDPALTEWENMQLNGYDRIWDCGNLKYMWSNHSITT